MQKENGLEFWTLAEANLNCRPLQNFNTSVPFESYDNFLYVPYWQFSTKIEPLKEYMAKHPEMGAYLVRVDLTDCRHVVLAFPSTEARDEFLTACEAIIVKR